MVFLGFPSISKAIRIPTPLTKAHDVSALDEKQELEKRIADGAPAPTEGPKALPLEAIHTFPAVFQPRGAVGPASHAHIRELARTPNGGHPLDPVTVYWVGDAYAVIDGHHRLAAYRIAKWQKDVPVSVFRGTLDDAIGYAGKLNSGEKLPMALAEKKAYAWRLMTTTTLSKEKIRLASGMSDGFLSNMRRIRTRLIKEMGISAEDVAGMSWYEAQRQAAGEAKEVGDIDLDEKMEQEAQDFANRLLKALGKRGQQQYEVLARALEIYDCRLPDALREHWDGERGELEFVGDEDPNSDF